MLLLSSVLKAKGLLIPPTIPEDVLILVQTKIKIDLF